MWGFFKNTHYTSEEMYPPLEDCVVIDYFDHGTRSVRRYLYTRTPELLITDTGAVFMANISETVRNTANTESVNIEGSTIEYYKYLGGENGFLCTDVLELNGLFGTTWTGCRDVNCDIIYNPESSRLSLPVWGILKGKRVEKVTKRVEYSEDVVRRLLAMRKLTNQSTSQNGVSWEKWL